MPTCVTPSSCSQRLQIACHRPEGPDLLPRPLARGADQDAGDDRLLMHVQPTTPLNDDLHPRLHPGEGDRDAAGIVETLLRVLPVPETWEPNDLTVSRC